MLLLVWDAGMFINILIITILHFAIDTTKLTFQTEKTKRTWFFGDQVLHILSLIIVWSLVTNGFQWEAFITEKRILLITAILTLMNPASLCIKIFISKWSPHTGDGQDDSLQSAGKTIGILERLFVFAFVITGHWQAIGFLLAAKSIFRFGDMRESRDRKLTEYILIGTLVSFAISIVIGVGYLYLRAFLQ